MICETVRIRCARRSPMMSEERVPVHVFYGMPFRLLQGGRKNTTIAAWNNYQWFLYVSSSYSYAQIIFLCLLSNMLTTKLLFPGTSLISCFRGDISFTCVLEFCDLSGKESEPSLVGWPILFREYCVILIG